MFLGFCYLSFLSGFPNTWPASPHPPEVLLRLPASFAALVLCKSHTHASAPQFPPHFRAGTLFFSCSLMSPPHRRTSLSPPKTQSLPEGSLFSPGGPEHIQESCFLGSFSSRPFQLPRTATAPHRPLPAAAPRRALPRS